MSRPEESRSFDGAGKLLARLAVKQPRAAFSLAGALGGLRNRVTGRWPSAAEVRALFPHLDARTSARVAAGIGALYERNRVLVRCILRHGLDPIRPLVSADETFDSLSGPRILATFHVGAIHALGPLLERLPSPVISFRSGMIFNGRGPLEVQSTEGNEQDRAAALHRALLQLRRGGLILMAIDVVPDQGIETRCLGRALRLAPGAFALARWTGAPIIPIAARWRGSEIRVHAGDEVKKPEDAAAWLESYLLESPSETTLGLVRMLLGVS